jgi:ABC-type glycerol-3-phosphate transport system substrate-binding protein
MHKRLTILAMLFVFSVLALVPTVSAQSEVQFVSFMTTFGGSELEGLRHSLDEFTQQTGIQVIIESNRQLVPILRTRLAGGSPPDVALIPQPGTLAEFARAGYLIPLVNADGTAGLIDASVVTDNYSSAIASLGIVDGATYGVLAKANSKSTMWYSPASFASLGVEVPTTWDELLAIQQAYVDAGLVPWSIGGSDNWTLTDWFENIYVRENGPEKYLQLFATHEVSWTDQSVIDALATFRQIVDPAETHLAGGVEGTLSTDFITAANMVFRPDPAAQMYYEGGFMGGIISSNFPDLVPVQDFNAFLFPAIDDQHGAPVVGGGDLLAAFTNRPEVTQLIQWMAGTEGNTLWASAPTGAVVSPNKNVDLSVYSPLAAIDAGQVASASAFVFDGSDLTPSAVSDAFGTGLQDFIANPDDVQNIIQGIEDAAVASY